MLPEFEPEFWACRRSPLGRAFERVAVSLIRAGVWLVSLLPLVLAQVTAALVPLAFALLLAYWFGDSPWIRLADWAIALVLSVAGLLIGIGLWVKLRPLWWRRRRRRLLVCNDTPADVMLWRAGHPVRQTKIPAGATAELVAYRIKGRDQHYTVATMRGHAVGLITAHWQPRRFAVPITTIPVSDATAGSLPPEPEGAARVR